MPGKSRRKIITDQRHMTLPKSYCDYLGVAKGDEVEVLFDSVLVVIPPQVKLSRQKKKALKDLLE